MSCSGHRATKSCKSLRVQISRLRRLISLFAGKNLFRGYFDQVGAEYPEEDIGYPHGEHGMQVPFGGKGGGYLHEEDKGEAYGDPCSQV